MLSAIRQRLGAKIALTITLIAAAVFTLLAVLTTSWMKTAMVEELERSVAEEAEILGRGIEKPMLVGDDAGTRREFAYMAEHLPGTKVVMTNFRNNITYSTDAEDVRKDLPQVMKAQDVRDLAARTLAQGQGDKLLLEDNGAETFLSTKPIFNEKSCHHCHGASQKVLGQFLIAKDVSAEFSAIYNKAYAIAGLCAFGLIMLVGTSLLAVHRMVVKPLATIKEATTAVAKGDYNANLTVQSTDELGQLSRNLSEMVHTIKQQLGFSQGVLNGMSVPCMVVDTEEKLTFGTPALMELVGRDGKPEDYYGSRVAEFFPGDPNRTTAAATVLATGQNIADREADFEDLKGQQRHAIVSVSLLQDLDGECIGAFSIFTDLTELSAQQQTIQEQAERIAIAAQQADQVAEQVSSSSEQLSAQIEQSSRGADEQRGMTGEAATAMEEMNATVLEVARSASKAAELADSTKVKAVDGEHIVEEAMQLIGSVAQKANALKHDMGELGNQADGIGQIVNVITDIADQTNLLALNAAIEAARAGDAGRGFALVADEVRKLAEKTMHATQEVGSAISAIQASAKSSIAQTEEAVGAIDASTAKAQLSGQALREIVQMVDATADQVRAIATASEEQSAASDEISRSTESVSRIAHETAEAMTESAQATRELAQLAHQLKDVIREMQA